MLFQKMTNEQKMNRISRFMVKDFATLINVSTLGREPMMKQFSFPFHLSSGIDFTFILKNSFDVTHSFSVVA